MSYTSFVYLFLITVVCAVYYIVPAKHRWLVLLGGNLWFYFASGWDNFIFLFVSIVASYYVALKMGRNLSEFKEIKKQGIYDRKELKGIKEQYAKKRRRYLMFGLFVVLGILIVVKYTNFILGNVTRVMNLFGANMDNLMVNMVVPLGISFYTFQMISYMMDVYNGNTKPQENFLRYALYSSFFPSVVQGPIPRYELLGKQLEKEQAFNFDNIRDGVFLILWGLVKKLVLAERLALFVNEIYGNYQNYEGVIIMLATAAFSIQIYADFAGCMDIVTGTARLFGIELQRNFLRPYFSKTMPEFWRRWHASLGSWFKDYVFYPFSISNISLKLNKTARQKFGNGVGRIVAASMPILVVWSLTGIWHGAEWKYVAWGLFHGTLIILSTIFGPYNEKLNEKLHFNTESFWFRLFQMTRTFILCCVGRVFFRAGSISQAIGIFKRSFAGVGLWRLFDGNLYTYGLNEKNMKLAIVLIVILWFVSLLEEKADGKAIEKIVGEQPLVVRWVILYALLLMVLVFGSYGPGYDAAAFIYEQF